jgi:PAS domain S-box-containing protein
MATNLRKTGISVVGDTPWGTHFCHFYETKQDLLDTLVPYFKAGLESNEFCLWVISNSDLITAEEAKEALAGAVPDLDRHLAAGNIEILNERDWYLDKDVLDLERVRRAWDARLKEALARGYDGLRASADTFWLRAEEWKGFSAYEKQINDWITDQRMTVMCTYPLAKSGAAAVFDLAQNHQFVISRRKGEWEIVNSLELIEARAEISRLNEAMQTIREPRPQPPAILMYGVAVLSASAALLLALWMRMELGQQSTPIVALFLCAVMLSAWFGGIGPGLLASALALLSIEYFFATPINSFAVNMREVPRMLIFGLSSLLVGFLSIAQRSKTESLRRARDVLDETVQELKRSNKSLRTENSERKHAEELLHAKEQEFRAIVENAPDQIIRYDREFRRLYVNPAVARFYDVPAETLMGKPLGSGLWEAGFDVEKKELARVRERIASVFNTGESSDFELTWTTPAGPSYFSIRFFPELDLNGKVVNVLGISRDISERMGAEERIRATSEQLRALSASLQSAREEEAVRIAREIHDELGSALTSLKMNLELIRRDGPPANNEAELAGFQEKIRTMMQLIDDTVDVVRRISSELRPSVLDDIGLIAAIRWQAQQFEDRSGIACHYDFRLKTLEANPRQSTAIFRVFQEALTNVVRHAQASSIDITLEKDADDLVLTISDNGRGITDSEKTSRQSLGLLGMQERINLIGGSINVIGIEGKGTSITVRVPLP